MASPHSPSLQPRRSASVSDTADHLKTNTVWSDEQEARLQHCQAELEKAQKRWSASQDLWIEEYRRLQDCEQQVDHLLELKKAHLKATKKQQAQAKRAVGIWKKRTWKGLSRTSSKVDTTASTPPDEDADDEGDQGQDEEEDDSLTQIEKTDSMQDLPPTSPNEPSTRRSSLSKAVHCLSIAGIRGKRKASTGGYSTGPSANQSEVATPTTVPEGFLA